MSNTQQHKVRWYGVIQDAAEHADAEGGTIASGRDLYVARTSHMNDRDWGWEAVCACGWRTRTGGAIAARIREAVAEHKRDVEDEAATVQCYVCEASVEKQVATAVADEVDADEALFTAVTDAYGLVHCTKEGPFYLDDDRTAVCQSCVASAGLRARDAAVQA